MHRMAEWYVLVTCVVFGISHIVQARAWADVYARLHRLGTPGAFVNGAISFVPGVLFVIAHPVWTWPGVVVTVFGCVIAFKGAMCFLVPSVALRSMSVGAGNPRAYVIAGAMMIVFAGFVGYVLLSEKV